MYYIVWTSQMAQCWRICLPMQEKPDTWVWSLDQEDTLEEEYSCQDNLINEGSWWGYSLWGHKELDKTEHACRHRQYSVDATYLVDFQYVPRWQLALSPFVTSVIRIVNIHWWNCCDYFAKKCGQLFFFTLPLKDHDIFNCISFAHRPYMLDTVAGIQQQWSRLCPSKDFEQVNS